MYNVMMTNGVAFNNYVAETAPKISCFKILEYSKYIQTKSKIIQSIFRKTQDDNGIFFPKPE